MLDFCIPLQFLWAGPLDHQLARTLGRCRRHLPHLTVVITIIGYCSSPGRQCRATARALLTRGCHLQERGPAGMKLRSCRLTAMSYGEAQQLGLNRCTVNAGGALCSSPV
jgi:hypothetical protein